MPRRTVRSAPTLAEELEVLGAMNEHLIRMREDLDRYAVLPLRVRPLLALLRETQRSCQEHYLAAEVLMTQPLADHFPDGSPAPTTYTARQVMYLAALAYPKIDHRQAREVAGLPPTRTCARLKADGGKCCQSSMLFVKDPTCYSHGTPAERERNRKAKERWNRQHPDYQL